MNRGNRPQIDPVGIGMTEIGNDVVVGEWIISIRHADVKHEDIASGAAGERIVAPPPSRTSLPLRPSSVLLPPLPVMMSLNSEPRTALTPLMNVS